MTTAARRAVDRGIPSDLRGRCVHSGQTPAATARAERRRIASELPDVSRALPLPRPHWRCKIRLHRPVGRVELAARLGCFPANVASQHHARYDTGRGGEMAAPALIPQSRRVQKWVQACGDRPQRHAARRSGKPCKHGVSVPILHRLAGCQSVPGRPACRTMRSSFLASDNGSKGALRSSGGA